MPYADDMMPASLGGVAFFMESVGSSHGRRTVIQEIPGSDLVAYEDLGRSALPHTIRGFVLGEDFAKQAKDLAAVFDRAGPHNFVHPLYGPRQVIQVPGSAPDISLAESARRMASVSFQVVEVSQRAIVPSKASPAAQLKKASAAAITASEVDLKKKWSLAGQILDAVVDGLNTAATTMRDVKRKALGPLAIVDTLDDAIDDFQAAANELAGTPADMLASLNQLTAELYSAILLFKGATQDTYPGETATAQAETALSAASDTFDAPVTVPPIFEGEPQDERLVGNLAALDLHLRVAGLAGACGVFADVAAPSASLADFAIVKVGELAELLLLDPAVSVDVHAAVRDLRDALLAQVSDQRGSIPRTRTWTPGGASNAIVTAWAIYGSPGRALEIVSLNKLRNPSFITQPIKVVVDG